MTDTFGARARLLRRTLTALLVVVLFGATVDAATHQARLSGDLAQRLASGSNDISSVIVSGTPDQIAVLAARYGARVKKTLREGAVLDVTGTRPGDEDGSVLFRLGPVRYAIVVQPFDGTLQAAARRLRQRITGTSGYQVTGAELAVATRSGVAGLQGGYTGPGRGGRYAVFVDGGHIIEVTVSGADLDLGRTLPAIEASTRTLDTS